MSVDRIKPVSYLFQMASDMLRSYDRLLGEILKMNIDICVKFHAQDALQNF